jgi:hypothetical protein
MRDNMIEIETEYVCKDALPGMVMDKVTRDEILTLLPDVGSLLAQMQDFTQ